MAGEDTMGADGGASAGGASLDVPGFDVATEGAPETEQPAAGLAATPVTGEGANTGPGTPSGMPYMPMGGTGGAAAGAAQNSGERSDAFGLLSADAEPWSPSVYELGGEEAFVPGAEAGAAALNLPQFDAAAADEPGTPAEAVTTEPFVSASESAAAPPEVPSADTAAAATAAEAATAGDDGFVPSQDQTPGGTQGGAVAGDPWDIAAGSLLLPLFGPAPTRTTEDEANNQGHKTSPYQLHSESGIWGDESPGMPTWRPDATGVGSARSERDEGEVSMAAAMRRIEEARQRISQAADEDAARAAEAEKEAEEEADNTREEGLRPTAVAHLLRQGDSQWGGARGSDLFG
ncbi:hypothetical protein ACFXKI_42655 [Streptomyces mirabilis]|uniref:hypothetical protein n=1 Tax=Streptomyces mirabilis TaxID=68239 RepID=UPI00368309E2